MAAGWARSPRHRPLAGYLGQVRRYLQNVPPLAGNVAEWGCLSRGVWLGLGSWLSSITPGTSYGLARSPVGLGSRRSPSRWGWARVGYRQQSLCSWQVPS